MPSRPPPASPRRISPAQRYLLVAAAAETALGWTYGAATTESRARALAWLPFPPSWLGWTVVALALIGAVATYRHRGIPEWLAWGAVSLAPGLLAAVWTTTALTHTPLWETAHALAAVAVGLSTGVVAVRWGRASTWRLLLVIVCGLVAAGIITAHGQVSVWTAWSSAVVYWSWVALIYLGAVSTSSDGSVDAP